MFIFIADLFIFRFWSQVHSSKDIIQWSMYVDLTWLIINLFMYFIPIVIFEQCDHSMLIDFLVYVCVNILHYLFVILMFKEAHLMT